MKHVKTVILLIAVLASAVSTTLSVVAYKKYKNIERHTVWQGFPLSVYDLAQTTEFLREKYTFLQDDYDAVLEDKEQEKLKEKIDELGRELIRLHELTDSLWTLHHRSTEEILDQNFDYQRIKVDVEASDKMYHLLKERFLRKYGTPYRKQFEPAGTGQPM